MRRGEGRGKAHRKEAKEEEKETLYAAQSFFPLAFFPPKPNTAMISIRRCLSLVKVAVERKGISEMRGRDETTVPFRSILHLPSYRLHSDPYLPIASVRRILPITSVPRTLSFLSSSGKFLRRRRKNDKKRDECAMGIPGNNGIVP